MKIKCFFFFTEATKTFHARVGPIGFGSGAGRFSPTFQIGIHNLGEFKLIFLTLILQIATSEFIDGGQKGCQV